MSLYQCIDLIDEYLKKYESRRLHFFRTASFLSPVDKEFVLTLRDKLNNRVNQDDYANLSNEIELIAKYLQMNTHISKKNELHFILNDLTIIQRKYNRVNTPSNSSLSIEYQKFQVFPYRIAELKQGKSFRLGGSKGECYGFTFSMVDPEISPYKNPDYFVQLNEKIHNYQKNQLDRNKDQDIIKRKRLTREHFCPNPRKQAEKIYNFAKRHEEKELLLSKRASVGAHACYVSQQKEGIRYMDPNHGVYLFNNKIDFIDFYEAASKLDKKYGADFRFYQIDELKYDPNNELTESKTIMGKVRTLLTGNKYRDHQGFYGITILGIYFTMGTGIGAVIGGLIGSAIMPGIGTIVGSLIGGTIGVFTSVGLSFMAISYEHGGVLGVPHFIENFMYNVVQKIRNIFSPNPDNTVRSEVRHNRVEKQEKFNLIMPSMSILNHPRSSNKTAIVNNPPPPLNVTHTFWKKHPEVKIQIEEERNPIINWNKR